MSPSAVRHSKASTAVEGETLSAAASRGTDGSRLPGVTARDSRFGRGLPLSPREIALRSGLPVPVRSSDIRPREVIALVQERGPVRLGAGVSEAIPEVEGGRMAAFPEAIKGAGCGRRH